MDNTRKLMRFEFSRYSLNSNKDNFTKEIFIKMLEMLPSGTQIRAFAEFPHRDVYGVLLSHDSFSEVAEGAEYPLINVIIHKPNYDIELKWPETYKQNHTCSFKTYQGFATIEEVCIICGKKK